MNSQLPDCIVRLTRELSSISQVTNENVSEAVLRAGLTEEALRPYALYNHHVNESYGRRLLFENDSFSILLMAWNPGDFTAVHDHGTTEWGAVHFLGRATHRLYETRNGKVVLTQKDLFEKNQTVPMHGELTHMMGNGGEEAFLTLHIYGSGKDPAAAAREEKVFLPEHRTVTATNGPAYLNYSEISGGEKVFFNSYGEEALIDYFNLVKPYYLRNNRADLLEKISSFEKDITTYYR